MTTPDELAAKLAEITATLSSIEAQASELAKIEQETTAEKARLRDEYQQRIYDINEKNAEAHKQFMVAKKEMERMRKEADSLQRQFEQETALKKAQEEYLTLEARWLALTENAKWREYAKPHQLEGAQRITFARKMVLADTVGLGKTLTAGIAATDLIKAATKDGDVWAEDMSWQEYHPQSEACARNSCRETEVWVKPDGFRDTEYSEGAVKEMYGKCEIIHHDPPAGKRILYICPVALTRNVDSEYKKWSGSKPVAAKVEPTKVVTEIEQSVDDFINSILGDGAASSPTNTITEIQSEPAVGAVSDSNTDSNNLPNGEKPRMVVNLSKQTKTLRRWMINDVIKDAEEFVVVINYEAWRKDASLIEDLGALNFDTCIIDEAHNVKDRKSIAYRGVRALLDGTNLTTGYNAQPLQVAERPIRFVIPMTGTPILNKPQELYTLLTLIDVKNFPNTQQGENNFLRDYCVQDYTGDSSGWGKWTFRPGGVEALLKRFGNRILRRDKKMAGIILPPQEIQYHELEILEDEYPDQCRARKEMREKAMIILDPDRGEAITAPVMLAVYTRLRQIETWPDGIQLKDHKGDLLLQVNIKQSQKLDHVIKYDPETKDWDGLLPEVCPSERTVIFSQFNGPLEEIAVRAKAYGLRVAFVRGGQSEAERNEIRIDADRYHDGIENYQTKYDLLLINYKAGGVGLNLNDFTQTIILDEEWNPGKRDQAYGRTQRMGQTEESTVHVIRMKDTIDTWMAALIEFKENMTYNFEQAASESQSAYDALRKGEI